MQQAAPNSYVLAFPGKLKSLILFHPHSPFWGPCLFLGVPLIQKARTVQKEAQRFPKPYLLLNHVFGKLNPLLFIFR